MKMGSLLKIKVMSKIILFSCIALCLNGCVAKNSSISSIQQENNESFESFLKRFCEDREFQELRIKFPLENPTYNTDSGEFEKAVLDKADWTYTDFNDSRYLKKIEKVNKGYTLNIQIEDTGISVNYFFEISNEKWFLTKVVDEST